MTHSRLWLRLLAVGVLLAALVAAGCTPPNPAGDTPKPDHPLLAVLGDTSCDSNSATIDQAVTFLEVAMDTVAIREGTVKAAALQDAALARTTWPLDQTFTPDPDKVPNGNSQLRKANLLQQSSEAKKQLAEALAKQSDICQTDLVGGFFTLEKAFTNAPKGAPTFGALFSNMLMVGQFGTDQVNFRHELLTTERIEKLLASLKASDQIPDLDGARLLVVGAGLDEQGRLTTAQIEGVEKFWRQFFDQAGAQVIYWGPTLPHGSVANHLTGS